MTNEKGKCYTRTPLFASFNTSSALHIFIFSVSYRPTRMSAPTDADVCTDRRGWHELMFCTYRGCTCLKCTNQSRTAQISQELHKSAKNYTNQPRTTQHHLCWCTYRGCTCLKCTNQSRTAPTNQELHQPTKNYTTPPLLVHLRQVHPLSNCTPQARTQKGGVSKLPYSKKITKP